MPSKLTVNSSIVTALLMTLIFASMSMFSLGFPEKARLMPLLVGIPGLILSLLQLYREVQLSAKENKDKTPSLLSEEKSGEKKMLCWLLLFFFGILGFGFVYAAPLLVFGFICLGNRESFFVGVNAAVGIWLVLFVLFETIFEIPLFNGLLIAWLWH